MAPKKYSCKVVDSADTYGRMIASHDKTPTDPNAKKSSDWLLTSDVLRDMIGLFSLTNTTTWRFAMKKFSFVVDIVAGDLDREVIVDSISSCLSEALPDDVHANVKAGEVKAFSEQGYKVWRARVTGVTAKAAGDAHNSKVEKEVEAVA